MKNIVAMTMLLSLCSGFLTAESYIIKSPDEKLSVTVEVKDDITFSVSLNNETILEPSGINMVIDGKNLGKSPKVQKVIRKTVLNSISPVVPRKYKELVNHYHEMSIQFRGNYSLVFRVYDEGVAYRWETRFKKSVKVNSELAAFVFNSDHKIWFPEEESMFSHQEREYKYIPLSGIDENMFCSTATLVDIGDNRKVFISEAELYDYPGMYLRKYNEYGLQGIFPHFPLKTEQKNDRDIPVVEYADFLAETSGNRSFPWRVLLITENDAQLIESEIIYKLSDSVKLDDVSWIKPGKVAWDWWNANNIYGVDFRAGINTETYKYYIDFASGYGIPYIILDEGWYNLENILSVADGMDVEELVRYGQEKNVGIILWTTWKALDDQLEEALNQFEKWGIKGIKVDFMQRDDQWMVNYYYKIAREAAKRKLLVDFHGAYKPTGMHRAYPNVISYEGVKGLENNKWSMLPSPEHNLIIPFIRMVTGPMDYTPGAMINGTKENFRIVFDQPMSLGTRCHQLALYVVFESPLQMLADNPSNYYREPECMEFLKEVPTTWDDTKVLHAKISEYIAIARKHGDRWFMGALTNWDSRSLELKLDFLEPGEYEIEIWKDGINADRYGADFAQMKQTVTNKSVITINMAPGGGWVAIVSRKGDI